MIAVWSFWPTPWVLGHSQPWARTKNMLAAWILSLEKARPHFPRTKLHTDDHGARLLVDELGLEFSQIELTLNALDGCDTNFWAKGKFLSYLAETEPFVHIDYDVFLLRGLPQSLVHAPVLAQSLEPFNSWNGGGYRPYVIESLIEGVREGCMPKEWKWYSQSDEMQAGTCCGIFGGNHLDFIHHYARTALGMLDSRGNRKAFAATPTQLRKWIIVHVEQYLLSAMLGYYQSYDKHSFPNLGVHYLLDYRSIDEDAERQGYVHLIGQSKIKPNVIDRLEARVRDEYPSLWERLERLSENDSLAAGRWRA